MATNDSPSAVLVQSVDVDRLIESIARSVVEQLSPLLRQADGPFLVNREEMAKRLDISIAKLDAMVRDEQIPSVSVGARRLFEPSTVIRSLSTDAGEATSK